MARALPRFMAPMLLSYRWGQALCTLLAALLMVAALGAADFRQVFGIWIERSAYRHCALVFLISLYLIWQLRARLARRAPRPFYGALPICAGAGALWLVGVASEVALLRHVALLGMLQSCVLLCLGKEVTRILLFPLAYLLFAIPFGQEIVPFLQIQTAHMSIGLLNFFEVPAYLNGTQIATPNGLYRVAEACAGVDFLMGMLAYGALLAYVFFRCWKRRALFMLLCVAVPILANGIRAFLTIFVGYYTTPSLAGGVDHIIYAWFFFAFIMGGMTIFAIRFSDVVPDAGMERQLATEDRPTELAAHHVVGASLGFALLMVSLQLWAPHMVQVPKTRLGTAVVLPTLPGWKRVSTQPNPEWQPRYVGADQIAFAQYESASGARVDMVLALYGYQRDGSELVASGQGAATGSTGAWIWSGRGPMAASLPAYGTVQSDIMLSVTGGKRLAVTQYHVGGGATGSAAGVKWRMVKARLLGQSQISAALILSAHLQPGVAVSPEIRALQAQIGPSEPFVAQMVEKARS